MTTKKLYIEIPHQTPPNVFWATDEEIENWAREDEAQWLMEHELYDDPTIDDCREAIGHDLHSFSWYDSVDEAREHFEFSKAHQHLKVLALLAEMLEAPDHA